ncbi:hypothetical protein [Robbsia andropogonis]|uniref:hypothetical protein n=1 Tax=Robbsia andropogonis TaxID=28092 RepID=UPI000465D7F8|nr:hypothetical protein [Robbsia andropogonis]
MKPQDFSAPHDIAPSQGPARFALRILRGWHAGAQIAVGPGETLRVGGQDDCDIMLTDDAVSHLTLRVRLAQASDGRVTGWCLRRQDARPASHRTNAEADRDQDDHRDGADNPPRADEADDAHHHADSVNDSGGGNRDATRDHDAVMPIDTPIDIGQLTVTVAHADAPWPAVHLPEDATLSELGAALSTSPSRDMATPSGQDGTIETPMATHGSTPDAYDASPLDPVDTDARVDAEEVTAKASGPTVTNQPTRAVERGPWGALRRHIHRAPGRTEATDATALTPVAASAGGVPTRWIMVAGALSIIAALFALFVILPRHAPPPVTPSPPPSNDILAQVRQALRAGGWSDAIRAERDPLGGVVVSGWVADDGARGRLSNALARLTPMPAMRIDIIAEAVQAARDMASHFGPFLSVDAGNSGQIRIRGVILPPSDADALGIVPPASPTASEASTETSAMPSITAAGVGTDTDPALTSLRTMLRDAFASAVPNATLADTALLTADGAVTALEDAMRAVGLPGAAIHWAPAGATAPTVASARTSAAQSLGQLVLDAPPTTDAGRLRSMLDSFHQRYGDRVPVRTLIGGSRASFTPTLLPFAIVSISSGPLPSVVVDGNVRLLPGGAYRGFRLIFVDDATVVFDRETAPPQRAQQGTARTASSTQAPPPSPSQRIVLQR